jgi:hypothetical protein
MSDQSICPICTEGKLTFTQTIETTRKVTINKDGGIDSLGAIVEERYHGCSISKEHFSCSKCGELAPESIEKATGGSDE